VLDGMTTEEVATLELPTGIPFVYRLDAATRVVSKEVVDT